ncbi:MAG: serine hydrolase domain-containing protein [Thermodesulfobacteriota bacterium]|jgi:CubicO group peptidase (beta-lactamase class C family)
MINNLPFADSDKVGMSFERLKRIEPMIRGYIDRQLIPGAVTMVARQGKIVHFDVHGFQNVEKQIPMTKETIFRIASMTKPITSVALMMLYEQGKFQLGDPISNWLPAYKNMQVAVFKGRGYDLVPADPPINVMHILTHTAGFATEYNPQNQEVYKQATKFRSRKEVIGDFVDRLATVPLNNHPGKMWDYSRATCVVGRLVEVLSGQTLAEYFQEHIFDPLGMTDTHFFLPEEKLPRFAVAYTPGEDKKIQSVDSDTTESFWLSKPGIYYMGSGGLVSTASDYFRFADMLMNGGKSGKVRILSRKTVELMTMNHIGDLPVWLTGPGNGFGLGFGVTRDRGQTHNMATEGTYTWGGAFCTYWWNDPREKLFGMVLTQVRPYDHLNIRADLQTIATQAIDD